MSTIADIARERIRLAGKTIGSDPLGGSLDGGFRALRVDTSNMADLLVGADDLVQASLAEAVGSLKEGRTGEDVLFQVLLDAGLPLSLPIVSERIEGHNIYSVAEDALLACFDDSLTNAVVREMAARHPLRVVFRDAGFATDAARINAEQIFREVSPETDVRTI